MKNAGVIRLVSVVLLSALLSACGDDAQARYDRATEALADAREQRQAAQERVQEKQQELDKLQAKLNEAEERLEAAREQLQKAKAKVNASVNDEVLFRTIQRKMLDEDRFGDAAIAVGVSDRVVTLTGSVPDKATRDQAIKLAENQSGVQEVVDFLEVEGARKDEKKSESGQPAQ